MENFRRQVWYIDKFICDMYFYVKSIFPLEFSFNIVFIHGEVYICMNFIVILKYMSPLNILNK